MTTDLQRRIAFRACVSDSATQLLQGINQIADRPFVHTGYAAQGVLPAQERQCSGERSHGSACIAQKQIGLRNQGATALQGAAQTHQMQDAILAPGHLAAKFLQAFQHHAGVVGIKQIVYLGHAARQRSQQQHTVGNAFRPRQAHCACQRLQGRKVEKFSGKHRRRLSPQPADTPIPDIC